jgi:hypothetical protein
MVLSGLSSDAGSVVCATVSHISTTTEEEGKYSNDSSRWFFPNLTAILHSTSCTSIVAILTLEVTGIPELSNDREFPWPKPSFVQPTRKNVFEVRLVASPFSLVFCTLLTVLHIAQTVEPL